MSTKNIPHRRYNLPDLCIQNILNFISDEGSDNHHDILYTLRACTLVDRNWCYISTPYLWSNPFTIVKSYVNNMENRKFEVIILDDDEIDQCNQDDNNQDKIKDIRDINSKDTNSKDTKSKDTKSKGTKDNSFMPHIFFQKLITSYNIPHRRYNLPDLCIQNILNFISDEGSDNHHDILYTLRACTLVDRNWCYISTPYLWSNPFTIVKSYVNNMENRKFEVIILDDDEIDQCNQDDNNQDKIKDIRDINSKDTNSKDTKSKDTKSKGTKDNSFMPHIFFQKLITSYVQSLPDDMLSTLDLNTPIENFHRNPFFNYPSFIRHLPMSQIFIAVLTFCVQSKFSFYNSPISFNNASLPLCYHSRDPIRRNAHVVICAKPTLLLTHLMHLFINNSPKIFSLELIGSLKPLASLASNSKYPHFLDLVDLNIFSFPNSSNCFKYLKNIQCFDNTITSVIKPLSLNQISTNIEEFAIKGSHADDIQSYHLSCIEELAKVIAIQQQLKVLSIDNINCATIVNDVNCMKILLEEGLSNSKVLETLTKIEFMRITFRSDRYSPINVLAKCKNLQHLIIKSCTNLKFSSSDESKLEEFIVYNTATTSTSATSTSTTSLSTTSSSSSQIIIPFSKLQNLELANVLVPINLLSFFTRCFKNTLRSLVVWLKTFRNYADIVLWIIEFNQLEFVHIYLTPQKIIDLSNLCIILEYCQELKEVVIEDGKYFEKVPEVFRLLNYGTIDANEFLCKIVMMLSKNVERITFKINFSFTPETLEFFISNAVSLKYLSFAYSASLTDEHLLILQELSNDTNIKTLNIGYAPNIDEEVINLAKEIIPEIIYWK
ncbi:hypothetical protein Glove_78g58 [Diversispora epigaea]|uniref:F-box domain-containing protein n=1 Tax=Diversispora epigaea TaxID=1348612 RepID=A0A397J8H6_9GLOM|nr:hypothetical protein Glove_78g58 [Diversispora epigaea]